MLMPQFGQKQIGKDRPRKYNEKLAEKNYLALLEEGYLVYIMFLYHCFVTFFYNLQLKNI